MISQSDFYKGPLKKEGRKKNHQNYLDIELVYFSSLEFISPKNINNSDCLGSAMGYNIVQTSPSSGMFN